MKKIILILMSATMLSGCAYHYERSNLLDSLNGVEFESSGEKEYIRKYTKVIKLNVDNKDSIPICVANSVTNRSVRLSDSSSSFVGKYSGNYYNIGNAYTENGGNVIKHVSGNGKSVVAEGMSEYSFNSGIVNITRIVRFTLDVTAMDGNVVYTFTNMQQAQTSTGSLQNDGFIHIGAWSGANPDLVIKSIDSIASKISLCLKNK